MFAILPTTEKSYIANVKGVDQNSGKLKTGQKETVDYPINLIGNLE
jgi:hypothetical protein